MVALIFWYGAHLVSEGKYSVLRMLMVFTLIIFSTTTAAETMHLGIVFYLNFPLTSSPTNIEIEGSRKSCSCFCSSLRGNRGVGRRQKIPSQRGNRNRKCHFFLPWFSKSSCPSQRRPENQRRRNHRRRRILWIGKKYRRKLDTTIL